LERKHDLGETLKLVAKSVSSDVTMNPVQRLPTE
jgi:hypothetical protein